MKMDKSRILGVCTIVCGALAVGATPASVTDFSVAHNPLVDVVPVVSWTVTGGEFAAKTFVQTSLFNDKGFVDVSEGFEGAGVFVFTNVQAVVGVPLYYRLRCADGAGDSFTAPVFCRRVRQLERDAADETKFAAGVTTLPEINYTTSTSATVGTRAISAFDGNLSSFCDVYGKSGGAVETVIGVCLPEAAHVTDVFMYPREAQKSRLSSAVVLSCTSAAAFEAHETHLLAGKQNVTTVDWYRYQPDDSETLYQCLFAYAGPLHDVGIGSFFGNVAEIRFYGWTPSDEAMAGLTVVKPTVTQDLIANASPAVAWGFAGDIITSAQLQVAEFPEGPWRDVGEEQTAAGKFEYVHADLPVGLPVYYRVSYDSRLFGEQVSESVAFRRVRQLERDAADETKLAAGVTTLPAVNYTTDNVNAHVNRGAISSFDGNAETSCDVYDSQTLGAVETVVGVGLPEAAHVTDVFMYPKSTAVDRLSSAVVLACVSSSAFEAKETHLLAGKQNVTDVVWYRYQPDDSETLYQCLFAYAGPLHDVGMGQFFGNVAEIRFYGWTPSDELAAGLWIEPPVVSANLPESSAPVVSWKVNGSHIISSRVEYSYSPDGPFVATGRSGPVRGRSGARFRTPRLV